MFNLHLTAVIPIGLAFLLLPFSGCDTTSTANLAPPAPPVGPPLPPPPPGAAPAAAPPAGNTSPAPNTSAPPPVNEHPDIVKFRYDWSPRGPYSKDHRHLDHAGTPAENEQRVNEFVAELTAAGADAAAQEEALARLINIYLSEARHDEISALLEPLLTSPSKRVQIRAVSQCSTWGTPRNLPTLTSLAALSDPYVSNFAVHDIYCITHDLSQVAKYLAFKDSYQGASRSFQEARSGEEHVWPLLASSDPEVLTAACSALFYVGTAQSAVQLGALKQHADPRVSGTARAAIHAIQKRAG